MAAALSFNQKGPKPYQLFNGMNRLRPCLSTQMHSLRFAINRSHLFLQYERFEMPSTSFVSCNLLQLLAAGMRNPEHLLHPFRQRCTAEFWHFGRHFCRPHVGCETLSLSAIHLS